MLICVFQTREFAKAGAFKGNNPADVVQSCDITFTCVSDSVAVRDVSTTFAVNEVGQFLPSQFIQLHFPPNFSKRKNDVCH